MGEILYCVEDERGNILAKDMSKDVALILVRALFETYYDEEDLAYTIRRQEQPKK